MANIPIAQNASGLAARPAEIAAKQRLQTKQQSPITTLTILSAALISAVALMTTLGSQPAQADGVVVVGGNGRLTIQTPGFGLSLGTPHHRGHHGYPPYSTTYRFPQTTYSTTTYSVNGGQSTLVITNPQVYRHPSAYGYSGVVIHNHPGAVTPSYSNTIIQNTRVLRRGDPRRVNVAPLNP
ncbi:MAG: hypothetical protein AAF215_09535 [Cyanobacteria bacterium P01_A01_bin.123]